MKSKSGLLVSCFCYWFLCTDCKTDHFILSCIFWWCVWSSVRLPRNSDVQMTCFYVISPTLPWITYCAKPFSSLPFAHINTHTYLKQARRWSKRSVAVWRSWSIHTREGDLSQTVRDPTPLGATVLSLFIIFDKVWMALAPHAAPPPQNTNTQPNTPCVSCLLILIRGVYSVRVDVGGDIRQGSWRRLKKKVEN